jgi:hypothetical protein
VADPAFLGVSSVAPVQCVQLHGQRLIVFSDSKKVEVTVAVRNSVRGSQLELEDQGHVVT